MMHASLPLIAITSLGCTQLDYLMEIRSTTNNLLKPHDDVFSGFDILQSKTIFQALVENVKVSLQSSSRNLKSTQIIFSKNPASCFEFHVVFCQDVLQPYLRLFAVKYKSCRLDVNLICKKSFALMLELWLKAITFVLAVVLCI